MKALKKILLASIIPGGFVLLAIQVLIWMKKLPDNFWKLSTADKWAYLKALATPTASGLE